MSDGVSCAVFDATSRRLAPGRRRTSSTSRSSLAKVRVVTRNVLCVIKLRVCCAVLASVCFVATLRGTGTSPTLIFVFSSSGACFMVHPECVPCCRCSAPHQLIS